MAFGVLFRIRLRHDYWLNRDALLHEALPTEEAARIAHDRPSRNWLEIVPTTTCRQRMAGHGILFKPTHDGALCGIELTPNSTVPRRPLGAGTPLQFGLRLTDPLFSAYTADPTGDFAFFSNMSGNTRGGELHLSQAVPAFDTARAYRAGDLRTTVSGSETQLFQALQDTGPSGTPTASHWARVNGDTHDPAENYSTGDLVISGDHLFEAAQDNPGSDFANTADWTDLGALANQYATLADTRVLRPATFSVDVASVATTRIDTELRRPGAATIVQHRRFEDNTPLQSIPVDLSGFAEGPFELTFQDGNGAVLPTLTQVFHLSPEALASGWMALIEIGTGTAEFALLDGSNQIRTPTFDLRFATQQAVFRYRFPQPQPVGTGAQVSAGADPADLVTATPRPLTLSGGGVLLREDDPTTATVVEEIRLPNVLPRDLQKDAGRWVATRYHPNFPPLV